MPIGLNTSIRDDLDLVEIVKLFLCKKRIRLARYRDFSDMF
jgi:hypothetical protein